jgi:hypothetical protein
MPSERELVINRVEWAMAQNACDDRECDDCPYCVADEYMMWRCGLVRVSLGEDGEREETDDKGY